MRQLMRVLEFCCLCQPAVILLLEVPTGEIETHDSQLLPLDDPVAPSRSLF